MYICDLSIMNFIITKAIATNYSEKCYVRSAEHKRDNEEMEINY